MHGLTPAVYLPGVGLTEELARNNLSKHDGIPGNLLSEEGIIAVVSAAQHLMPTLDVFVTRLPDGHLRMWATIPGSLRIIRTP